VRIGLVVILFSVLIYSIHPAEIILAFKQARPLYLLYAAVLMVPNLLLQLFKWRFVMRNLNPRPSIKTTAVSLFGGFFLGATTPGRTGEIARGLLIHDHSKLTIASLTVVDKGFSQLMIYLFGLTTLGFILPWPLPAVIFLIEGIIIVILFKIHRLRPALEKFFHFILRSNTTENGKFTYSQRVDNALAAFDALSVRTVLGMVVYSILFYLTFTFQLYCLILCYTDISFFTAVQTIPLIFFFNSMFPIAIGDLGIKEFFAVHVLGVFGIAGGPAFSASLTQNVLAFLIPSLIGGIVFAFSHPRRSQEAPASDDRTVPLSEK